MRVEVIAEIGANHGSTKASVCGLISMAQDSGADAVKIQLYQPDSLTIDAGFKAGPGLWEGVDLYALYTKGALPRELVDPIAAHCRLIGMPLIASVYCAEDVKFAVSSGVDWRALKIASFEANDHDLISLAAQACDRLILSTGMQTSDEVLRSIAAADPASIIGLLHCVSEYPTPAEHANLGRLNMLHHIADRADALIDVGLSDHTRSTVVPALAVALGATIIEKHIDRERYETSKDPGLDSDFALGPFAFTRMVHAIREAEKAMRAPQTDDQMRELRRSLRVVKDVGKGERFTESSVRAIRPAGGMEPYLRSAVIGRRASRALKRGEPLTKQDVDGFDAEALGAEGNGPPTEISGAADFRTV